MVGVETIYEKPANVVSVNETGWPALLITVNTASLKSPPGCGVAVNAVKLLPGVTNPSAGSVGLNPTD